MRRRRLLRAGAAALGLAAAPGWIRRAFADISAAAEKAAPAQVAAARQRAFSRERPLVVIVVPDDEAQRPQRGRVWGAFLNHGKPAELAPLGTGDVICARVKDLALPSGGELGEPWLVVLAEGAAPRASAGKLPGLDSLGVVGRDAGNQLLEQQIAALAKMVKDVLLPAGAPAPGKAALDEALRLRKEAPPGSRWDQEWDCPPCGMAMTPFKSRRFLTFLVKGEKAPELPFPHLMPDHDHDKH
jgi:hypothetical protein